MFDKSRICSQQLYTFCSDAQGQVFITAKQFCALSGSKYFCLISGRMKAGKSVYSLHHKDRGSMYMQYEGATKSISFLFPTRYPGTASVNNAVSSWDQWAESTRARKKTAKNEVLTQIFISHT